MSHDVDDVPNFDRLQALVPELDDTARRIGLYMDDSRPLVLPTPTGEMVALVANFTVGDVAWSPRVQEGTEADWMERQFHELEAETLADQYLDAKAQMERNVAAGRDPLDDGDDG